MINKLARVAATLGLLAAARKYYRNWGTTRSECQMPLPGDELIHSPAARTTQGVWIDAPTSTVWPWMVQLCQDQSGSSGNRTLKPLRGLQYRQADVIDLKSRPLAPGDDVRLAPRGWMGNRDGVALRVVDVCDTRSIVLRSHQPPQHWDAVWTFLLDPHQDNRCRLIVRCRTGLRHPGDVLVTEIAGPALAIITRELLIGIKHRAEEEWQGEASAAAAMAAPHRGGQSTNSPASLPVSADIGDNCGGGSR